MAEMAAVTTAVVYLTVLGLIWRTSLAHLLTKEEHLDEHLFAEQASRRALHNACLQQRQGTTSTPQSARIAGLLRAVTNSTYQCTNG